MSKYLLLGGTGAIGDYLINNLLNVEDVEIYVTSRSERKSTEKVKYLKGDAHEIPFIQRVIATIKDIDMIIDFLVWKTEAFEEIHKIFLLNCKKYIYMSSARIYSNCDDVISETTPRLLDVSNNKAFLERDSYAIPKGKQEDILQNSGFNNYLILRPYITYSEKRLPLCGMEKEIWLYRVLHGRTIVMPNDVGSHFTSLTFGDDCAKAIYNIIVSGVNISDTVNISINETITWNDILSIYEDVLNERGFETKIHYIKNSIKAKDGDYQTIYDRLYDRRFDTTKLESVIDVGEFKKMATGLRDSLNLFLDYQDFNVSLQNWRFQAELDCITREKANGFEFTNRVDYIKYLFYRYLPISWLRRTVKRFLGYM
jgi:nucleoside-diphosphate-sugar epimerase